MDTSAHGLPPVAAARVERQRASGTAGSLLTAAGAAAVRAAGLAPAGEVFGCCVVNLGWTGGYCGAYQAGFGGFGGGIAGGVGGGFGGGFGGGISGGFGGGYRTPVVTSGQAGGSQYGFAPYVRTLEGGWASALERMLAEASALGADGVVGVVTRRTRMEARVVEFTATGTAVRALDPALARAPSGQVWAAELTAEDTAAAIAAGLLPRGLALGVSVSTKHEDWELRQQRSSWTNTEVRGFTELLQAARADARARLDRHAARFGSGDVVIDRQHLATFETSHGEEVDLHAEATFAGTVLAPAGQRRRPSAGRALVVTPVIPLSDPGARTRRRR